MLAFGLYQGEQHVNVTDTWIVGYKVSNISTNISYRVLARDKTVARRLNIVIQSASPNVISQHTHIQRNGDYIRFAIEEFILQLYLSCSICSIGLDDVAFF